MIILKTATFLVITSITTIMLPFNIAFAHRFNVGLVIPDINSDNGQSLQIKQGFMLATTEQDSHPDEESDGHLGGLDVYVTVADVDKVADGNLTSFITQNDINIIAVFGPAFRIKDISANMDVALLRPGKSPFSETRRPAVAAFTAAYTSLYGSPPSASAAQGYNAARRIAKAVRAQSGVDDIQRLQGNLEGSMQSFSWQRSP